jgi:hypothetical protein
MQYAERLSRNLNKIQKLWSEQGAIIAFKKILHLAERKFGQPAAKRTLAKRDLLFKDLDADALRQDMEFFFSAGLLRPPDKIKSDVKSLPAEISESIRDEADRILKNEFTLYGYQQVSYDSNRFSWTYDPLTEFKWPRNLSRVYARNQKPYGTDIKTIWEIARFHFLSPLAYAYILTAEEKYVCFALDKINSWIDENLFLKGPHWIMPMESAIRLTNWCFYLPLLDIFKHADSDIKNKITESFLEHLLYIRENLEVSPSQAGNHYLSNLIGLILSRLLFPSLPWAIEISEFAINEFAREIQNQFKESGINFEGSLQYHRLSSEMSLLGAALIKKNGEDVLPQIVKRLKKIARFTRYYTDICEDTPLIGDNDNGIFVRFFSGQELNRHGYLSYLFDTILENKCRADNFEEFLCSVHFVHTYPPDYSEGNKCKKTGPPLLKFKKFDGLIIARNGSEAIFFNTLHSSQGHSHNDKLSIYPVVWKKPLFLDRGSYSYSGFRHKRQQDRMSASHNGPVVNDWEQNTIWEDDLYYVNGEAKCFHSVKINGSILTITGWHTGYKRFSKGLTTYRKVEWNTKERIILVEDWLEGKASQETFQIKWHFLINPIWQSSILDNCFAFTYQDLSVYFEDFEGIGFKITQSHYCPTYQVEKSCEALNASLRIGIGEKIRFRLRY